MRKELRLSGIPVVPGKGMGKAFFVGRAMQDASTVSIRRQDVGDQIMQFNEVREAAKKDYQRYYANREGSPAEASIIKIYEHILDDPAFIGQIAETVSTKLYDLETAIRMVSNDFIKRFNSANTSYFKERSSDMVEICERLISYINKDENRLKTFLEPVVLIVSRMFTPTDILGYDREKIEAVVTASGGKTSHAAILARTFSIPVVSGIRNINEHIHPGDQVFVDADKGVIIARPSGATVNRIGKKRPADKRLDALKAKWNKPVYTRDGIQIDVLANISFPEDADTANEYGADGIGLVRTEYVLTSHKRFPQEDIQQRYFSDLFARMKKKHCVIRIMDIGGDKIPGFFDMPSEFNPFMGWRAIRIFLERKDLFETQIRAILQAGEGHDYSLMVPMITTLQEWLDTKEFIQDVARRSSLAVPRCGVLFEVPLAVLEMEAFMKDIDFASIGTNDLIQYLSAADRNNAKVNYLYNPIEPAFVKIIKSAIDVSNDNGKPLSICGEMAGNPFHTILLIGLGLRRFSVNPRNIPILKELISRMTYAEAAESVSHIESLDSTDKMYRWLKNLNKRIFGDVLNTLPMTADV